MNKGNTIMRRNSPAYITLSPVFCIDLISNQYPSDQDYKHNSGSRRFLYVQIRKQVIKQMPHHVNALMGG